MVKHIKEIYDRGLLPAAAYREVLRQLKTECKNNLEYHKKTSDRSQAPRRNDFYREYKKGRFGCGSLPTMFLALQGRIKFLQEKDEDYILSFQVFNEAENCPIILVIITPLMKKVHGNYFLNILLLLS